MDVLQVVRQLRDLAADPQNRTTIVRGCLPGLVVFLDNRNPGVVATALEVWFVSNFMLMAIEMCSRPCTILLRWPVTDRL